MVKLLFAPMATLSHEAMRLIIERYSPGAVDEYYTEMIHAASFLAGGKFEPYYVRTAPDLQRIVWQLTGGTEEPLAKASKVISKIGGIGIDINMGCAAPEIVRQGAGVAWMLKPMEETQHMLKLVRASVPDEKRLSVKMRLGGDDFTEKKLFDFVDMLVGEGVSQIVIHPRTQKEKFKRVPHWVYAQKLAEYIKSKYGNSVCICGNGDITDSAALQSVCSKAPGLEGYMIGRAAVQKPWIFAQLKAGLKSEAYQANIDLQELGLQFVEDLKVSQPEEFWKTRAQRFFVYFCKNFTFGTYLSNKLINAKTLDEIKDLFCSYFEEQPDERFLNV